MRDITIAPKSSESEKALVMKATTSLCFTKDGLINPQALSWLSNRSITTAVLFSDGSEEAYQKLCEYDFTTVRNQVGYLAMGKVPLYDLRVIGPDGEFSQPHYLYSEENFIKWVCSKICTPYLTLSISDVTSQNPVQVKLDEKQTELFCYLAYKLWSSMLVAEDRLCFPAVVIDRMTRWTYSLTPQTLDIALLRKEVGLESLDYNPTTDMLSISVLDETFTVKLSVLNAFYGEFILPLFNSIMGRRLRLQASVIETTGKFTEPTEVSYGELGKLVDDMRSLIKEKKITASSPMDKDDLLLYAKKLRISNESCFWASPRHTTEEFIRGLRTDLVRGSANIDQPVPELTEA